MSTRIRVGHCQLECRAGDFSVNRDKVVAGLAWAQERSVQIVSFPECFLTGYFDREEPARRSALAMDGSEIADLLDRTRCYDPTFLVGFNEKRGGDIYNTVLVARGGQVLGAYSKCSAYMPYHKQGRAFPVFERAGVRFGVIICSDGGYIEPTRILALKGAKIVFAPHYNHIAKEGLLNHFRKVRSDHTARAVENNIWFLRGNSVAIGPETGLSYEGVGYGDSYLVDPLGEIAVRSARHVEDFIEAWIDVDLGTPFVRGDASLRSARVLGRALTELADGATLTDPDRL
ncbi:MAG: carbon-nitrogen hydrolase family protein [Phycisphaerales bacterium]